MFNPGTIFTLDGETFTVISNGDTAILVYRHSDGENQWFGAEGLADPEVKARINILHQTPPIKD